ncbi:acyl-CoA thioesterase [Vulcanisaeta moutnovskia]|nr:thioesterase family protein [Vulcanisaeta moutnovskia]
MFKVQLRYSDTDQMGVIYFARYFVYADEAITSFMKERDIDIVKLEKEGIYFAVASAHCDYEKPIKYSDNCLVKVQVSRIGNTSVTFNFEIMANNEVVANGYIVYVLIDKEGKKKQLPGEIRKSLVKS